MSADPSPVVILRRSDGGLDLLAEDRTYVLAPAALRSLLFYGNRVALAVEGAGEVEAAAWPGFDRAWICFGLDRALYLAPRARLVAVLRGGVAADRLVRVGRL